ncbi:hypothetical protein AB205_0207700 [Aquarana catesbeiana]|uniref:Uncharacterized protein n=1 Tax=Aquarana catesbeiana TaxID=8400 RepID=A0A2G9SF53_AQUCT|nr:hypothetical protein AB205_0207700 [Aquarana catesbeiana]
MGYEHEKSKVLILKAYMQVIAQKKMSFCCGIVLNMGKMRYFIGILRTPTSIIKITAPEKTAVFKTFFLH